MNGGSIMVMYGSRALYGRGIRDAHLPCIYGEKTFSVDAEVNAAVIRHVDHLSSLEHAFIPCYATHRDEIADRVDPNCLHRFSNNASAFAVSFTSSYVVSPHDDSGLACA